MIETFWFVRLDKGDAEERSLEMTKVSREGGKRWWRQESGLQVMRNEKRSWKSISPVF